MSLTGTTIAVGCVFHSLRRRDVQARLESLGASVVDEVSGDTDLLVLGGFGETRCTKSQRKKDQASCRKAENLGLPVWGEIALVARFGRREEVDGSTPGAVHRAAVLKNYGPAEGLTLVGKREVASPKEFGEPFLRHVVDYARARLTVVPSDLEDALENEDGAAPFETADGVNEENICHPFTLGALCSGDVHGYYEVFEFHLGGELFRRVVRVPAGNCASYVFSPAGDCLYELSELMGHDLESLAVCALIQEGGPGDSLADLVERGVVSGSEYGWSDFLTD